MDKAMALRPKMSEKAYGSAMTENTYVFMVPKTATKHTVAKAVSAQFDVVVSDVRVVVVKGKTKKSYKKGSRPTEGKRANIKKAYVRLAKDSVINIFGDPEADKKSKKKSAKETK